MKNIKEGNFIIGFIIIILILTQFTFSQRIPEKYFHNLPFPMPKIQLPNFPEHSFNIIDYGAIPDGHTLNTKAFNSAIKECAKAGGGKVIVPAGLWLTGPIRFESNVNLFLDAGALIMFSKNRDDYSLMPYPTPKSKKYQCEVPIYGYKLTNVAITGEGIIDGSGEVWRPRKKEKYTDREWKKIVSSGGVLTEDGKMWWPSKGAMEGEKYFKDLKEGKQSPSFEELKNIKDFLRSNMIVFYGCNNVLLDGPTFRNSPKFCINPIQCENIVIRNVKVQNDWNAQNGDGIDIGSCHNVVIYNCIVDVGDDAICLKPGSVEKERNWQVACENIVIEDCIVYRGHGGFVIGSETYGGTRNVSVRNCTFIGTDIGLRFKTARDRGGLTENIYINKIQMKNIVNEAILFDAYYESNRPELGQTRENKPVTELTPIFQNFFIENIVCNGADRAIFIQGLPEKFISKIEMKNLIISAEKGVVCIDAQAIKFDDVKILTIKSPLFDFDNVKDIILRNVSFAEGIDLFMKIKGKETENIQIVSTDLHNVKKDFEFTDDVKKDVIIKK